MSIKKFLTTAVLGAMMVPVAIGFSGCNEKAKFDINAKDVYALCATSSVEYLQKLAPQAGGVSPLSVSSQTRPATVTDDDINGIKNNLSMFDNIVSSGLKQTVSPNTSQDPLYADYTFVMETSFPSLQGMDTYKMYYSEKNAKTEEEIDDEEYEAEFSTTIEGVIVVNGVNYPIQGKREFEVEGNEKESSIEFKTYLDNNNYIVYEQSVENNEVEYEYAIYKNGQIVQETEFEIEKTKKGYEIDFELLDLSSHQPINTQYEIKMSNNQMLITIKKNSVTERIYAEKLETGYRFTYANGFSEEV